MITHDSKATNACPKRYLKLKRKILAWLEAEQRSFKPQLKKYLKERYPDLF